MPSSSTLPAVVDVVDVDEDVLVLGV